MLAYLEQSQWWSAEKLLEHQLRQLRIVLIHAKQTSSYYQRVLSDFELHLPLTMERWQDLPILRRTDIQQAGSSLYCSRVPLSHGKSFILQSTGSTGQPVATQGTALTQFFWNALTLREMAWNKRSPDGSLAIIRAFDTLGKWEHNRSNWGTPFNLLYQTGSCSLLNILTDIREQAQWLQKLNPHYLLTYASNLVALLRLFENTGNKLTHLRQVRTISETVTPEIRDHCLNVWGVPIVDLYSSSEAGNIAFQCPDGDCYHIQSESLLVEILDDFGNPCLPGQIGQIVVSTLHNFASPMIRYAIGDYAEIAEPCKCGRGLMAIKRVLGRRRNLLSLPTGEKFWPRFGFKKFGDVAKINQFQVIQRSLDALDIRLVVDRQLDHLQEDGLRDIIRETLGYPFEIFFTYHDSIISKAGKHEEFISEVL